MKRIKTWSVEYVEKVMATVHFQSKSVKWKTCNCFDCGQRISWDFHNCFTHGVYLCPECFENRKEYEDFHGVEL